MDCFTIAPTAALVNFSLSKNKIALINVTAGKMATGEDEVGLQEVLVSEMWHIKDEEVEADITGGFKQEVQLSMQMLAKNGSKKRKRDSMTAYIEAFRNTRTCTEM